MWSELGAQVCNHALMHQASDPSEMSGLDPNAFTSRDEEGANPVDKGSRVTDVKSCGIWRRRKRIQATLPNPRGRAPHHRTQAHRSRDLRAPE